MNFSRRKIRKPLASVDRMIMNKKKVVFDLDDQMVDSQGVISVGSYIEDKNTGKRIYMTRVNGGFVLNLKVIPFGPAKASEEEAILAPLAQAPTTESAEVKPPQGFPRQVQKWP